MPGSSGPPPARSNAPIRRGGANGERRMAPSTTRAGRGSREETAMKTFETPEPISVTVELGVGDLRVVASARTDTAVDVRPSDPSNRSDVMAAEQTLIEYANGRLLVRAPKGWRKWSPLGPRGRESIDVLIEVPSGSSLSG